MNGAAAAVAAPPPTGLQRVGEIATTLSGRFFASEGDYIEWVIFQIHSRLVCGFKMPVTDRSAAAF